MAFEERNFVDTYGRERSEGIPINACGDPAIQDTEERGNRDILLGLHIGEGTIDHLDNQMALIRLGM